MLERLADLTTRRPKRILAITLVAFLVAAVFGGPVAGLLGGGDGSDFNDPEAESLVAAERIDRLRGVEAYPRVVVLVRAGGTPVAQVRRTVAAEDGVAETTVLRGRDGQSSAVAATMRDGTDAEEVGERLEDRFEGARGVFVGGSAVAGPAVGDQVSEDLARAEMLAFPLLFLLSLWVFRGVVAALLPLFVGVLTIFGTFLGLRLVNAVEPLSIFALNLAIALGLGLAIDYSLFVVSRYREERRRDAGAAMRRTLATAGRTVLFSSATVAVALMALLVFPQRFLYSMGISGAIAALLAGLVAVTALPALLAALGPRVDALALPRWRREPEQGFWYRLSHAVMRRPLAVALVTTAVLVLAGLPALRLTFTGVDASVLPDASAARQVDDALRTEFPPSPTAPVTATIEAPASERAEVERYAAWLGERPGVAEVQPPQALDGVWVVSAVPAGGELDDASLDLVRDARAGPAPGPVQVSGRSAEFVDQQESLAARLPVGLAILAATTFTILFVLTGSVILPLKSLVMNLLSLSAAFGLLVLIFQDGRFESLLAYDSQGALEATQPVLLFAVAFALSTDYGVFLLTRIKEAHDSGLPNEEAVAVGLQRTGRIVTAAALLLSVALGAFATSEIIFIKQVGLGTVFAVLIDATIIRALLVPALMALLGEWNWWAPRPLKRLHARLALSHG
jgi:RND superfamily putative drug exporter